MSISRKYGRTYHYPFSPGTSSDDRINLNYWEDIKNIKTVIHTEKLDGENNCLSRFGVFARSHVAPTTSPWTKSLRERWDLIKNDLGDVEIFGENLYAIHSIEYRQLKSHFYVFAVRSHDVWLGWEEVEFYAAMFDFPTVPVLKRVAPIEKSTYQEEVMILVKQKSVFDSYDINTQTSCTCEGVVSRNEAAFNVDDFGQHVFKYVRKGHVKTDAHWTRNWRRAKLMWEYPV
jgi:hypothetical protein